MGYRKERIKIFFGGERGSTLQKGAVFQNGAQREPFWYPWYPNVINIRSENLLRIFKGLRILASYAPKIAKICNFWSFWPVIKKMVL